MSEIADGALQRAAIAIQRGNHRGAIEALRDVLTEEPDHASAHALLAHSLLATRRRHAARYEADRALACAPEFDFAHRVRAMVAMAENDLPRAEDGFRKAIELDPADAANYLAFAHLERRRGRRRQAIELIEKAIVIDGGNPQAQLARGHLELDEGRLDGAEAAARQVLSGAPDDADAQVLLGMVRLRRGDIEGARELALWALQNEADNSDALELLVDVKARQSWFLGLWWRYNVWMGGLGVERAIIVLILAYMVYSVARMALVDAGQRSMATGLTIAWLIVCIYTWSGGAMRDRMVARELAGVKLKREF